MSGAVLIDKVSNCAHHTSQLMGHQELAMDIEGINLCRTGRIALIQLCTKSGEVFLFDIAVLGQDAFDKGGLRAVLESEQICKVIFDGRADADALYHQFHVQIRHAFDLQVQHALRFSNSNDRYVKGLKKCLSDANVVPLMERERLEALKEEGLRLFAPEKGGRYEVWMERPLNQALVDYAAADVKYLLSMKAIWHASQDVLQLTRDRLQGAVQAAVPAKGQHMSVRDFSLGQHPQYLGREAVSQKRRVMGGTGPMKRSRPMGGSNQFGLDDDLDLDDICDPFDGFFGYGSD